MLSKHLIPFHISNENLMRIGPKKDGGYIIDKRIIPLTKKIITCGLNDDWEFERSFLKIQPNCKITAYDHTVNKKFWAKRFGKDIIHFFLFKKLSFGKIISIFKYVEYLIFFKNKNKHYKLKIGKQCVTHKEISLPKILKDQENLLLKIDIEGDEYEILEDIIKNSKKINCLLIEFHFISKNILLIEKFIKDNEYLKLIHIHGNNYAGNNDNGDPLILELTFLNIEKIKFELYKTKKNFPVSGLDYKNHQKKDDFFLKFNR
tara:strand:- start:88 stop:870 length:783 start_codon:yes stop_codon:yes gene_type:complete